MHLKMHGPIKMHLRMHVNDFLHLVMDFLQRLDFLLDGRKKYEWGGEVGLNRGVIAGMFDKGALPGWETLTAISRSENASLDWLTTGRGAPFYVHRHTDDGAAEVIRQMLSDENWEISIGAAGRRLAVALHQPVQHQMKPKEGDPFWINYRLLELFPRPGIESLSVIAKHAGDHDIRLTPLADEQIDAIEQGRAGTRRLLLARDAWLANGERIGAKHAVFSKPGRDTQTLVDYERDLISELRAMSPDVREHYLAIARVLAPKKPRT